MCAISCTARLNASSLALEGFVDPLILRTYCSAAASTSSWLAAGSKLWRTWMFLHMSPRYAGALTFNQSLSDTYPDLRAAG